MKNCKNCAFCKRDLINDYFREADLHKCEMDGDMILDPGEEGRDCAWFKSKKHERRTLLTKIQDWLHMRNN